MAKIVKSDKDLKIIEFSSNEMTELTHNPFPVCDDCNEEVEEGYYIAVLNQWFCRKCADEWHKQAKNYPEDREVEERNFNFYKGLADTLGMFNTEKQVFKIKFVCIDYWNRPIFKITNVEKYKNLYLSDVDNLFRTEATDEETEDRVKCFYQDKKDKLVDLITIHGYKIDTDPSGLHFNKDKVELEII